MRSHESQPRLYDYLDGEGNKMIIAGSIDFAQFAKESDRTTSLVPIVTPEIVEIDKADTSN